MKKLLVFTMILGISGVMFYACKKEDVKFDKKPVDKPLSSDFENRIDSIYNKVVESSKDGNQFSYPKSNSADVQMILDGYFLLYEDRDYIFDEDIASQDAIDEGITLLEAKKSDVKMAYKTAEFHSDIFEETNFTAKQTIEAIRQWQNVNQSSLIDDSGIFSDNGKLIINSYLKAVEDSEFDNYITYNLASIYYSEVENSDLFGEFEKTSLKLAFAIGQASTILEDTMEISAMDPCQTATLQWIGGTILAFGLCDGCAAGAYAVGVVGVALRC